MLSELSRIGEDSPHLPVFLFILPEAHSHGSDAPWPATTDARSRANVKGVAQHNERGLGHGRKIVIQ